MLLVAFRYKQNQLAPPLRKVLFITFRKKPASTAARCSFARFSVDLNNSYKMRSH